MSERIALDTVGKLDAPSPTPCAFAAGETTDAPECSAALVVDGCRQRFEREAVRGECDTGRYRMPYRVWGQGPALIVIPGLCDSVSSLAMPLARLSRSFCCIAYDLPTGRGDGARLSTITNADLVDDLFALMDHLKLNAAAPLGISFGSTIALSAMARDPQRFPVGILQGGFAKRPLAWTEILFARFARYWPGRLIQLPLYRAVVEKMYRGDFASGDPARWEFFLKSNGDCPIASVAHRALLLNAVDLRELLPKIRQPVGMICSDHDQLIGRDCEETLRAGLPNVARFEIENCGHIPQFTNPEVLCEVIEQFAKAAGVLKS